MRFSVLLVSLYLTSISIPGWSDDSLVRPGDVIKIRALAKHLVFTKKDGSELRYDRHTVFEKNARVPTKKVAKQLQNSFWVVLSADWSGGGTAQGEVISDGLQVLALRLNADGGLDSKSELLSFSQTGPFSTTVEGVKKFGEMDVTIQPRRAAIRTGKFCRFITLSER